MKLISNAHVDSHTALLARIRAARFVHKAVLQDAKAGLARTEEFIFQKNARPFYVRWTDPHHLFGVYTTWHDQTQIWAIEQTLQFLDMLEERAAFELTIELDDRESNILFRKLPDPLAESLA